MVGDSALVLSDSASLHACTYPYAPSLQYLLYVRDLGRRAVQVKRVGGMYGHAYLLAASRCQVHSGRPTSATAFTHYPPVLH